MRIIIEDEILESYPATRIGYLLVGIQNRETCDYVESLKDSLPLRLSELGIDDSNLAQHPDIQRWRPIYASFGVKPSKYRSSVESLLRRLVKGQPLWPVSCAVDLYNCVSAETVLPMGGYDRSKIQGDLRLRRGRPPETFRPLGSQDEVGVGASHVVYADDGKVLCHLWNHRDSRDSAIDLTTERALFFIDSAFPPQTTSIEKALQRLSGHLQAIGARVSQQGLLDARRSQSEIIE